MTPKPHVSIIAFSEERLSEYGDTPLGVGWPRNDADVRYQVMLDLFRPSVARQSLLDFGCGASHLYEYILRRGIDGIDYSGLDLSSRFLALSRQKFPDVPYYQIDVLDDPMDALPVFDYVVLNGIFNYRGNLPHEEMFDYLRRLIRRVSPHARIGLAFNVMSTQVDWYRDDLFHLPLDPLVRFLATEVSRHVVVRHDYGLYEYTVYVYMTPTLGDPTARHLVRDTEQG